VFDKGYGYLTVEGEFRILDGPDAPEQSWRLFDAMQSSRPDRSVLMWYGRPLNRHAFLEEMREARRLIYELTPTRSYGLEAAARG
jgi:hypothetical protein